MPTVFQHVRYLSRIWLPLLSSIFLATAGFAEQRHGNPSGGTADHTKFEILQKDFKSGIEVTAACLTCHTEASKQVKQSLHWTWDMENKKTGQRLGKRHVINSFCGNVTSNEPRCTSCHVGYGWDDMAKTPPDDDSRVDCLICHDTSRTYTKLANKAGAVPMDALPPKAKTITGTKAHRLDLAVAAQSVGLPDRQNCGQCHFFGGGGDNVKHGDLSSALHNPSESVDVHMAEDGLNFACSTCHRSKHHQWAGSRYSPKAKDPIGIGLPGVRRNIATCESCHSNTPHKDNTLKGIKLNDHVDRIACQTCHIPAFARGGVATKTKWDWSTAGRLKDGKPYAEDNFVQSDGKRLHTYMSAKGHFEYGENVQPHYAWFNGEIRYTTGETVIDPSNTVVINPIEGSADDVRSRIWPFKLMEGRQAYDKVHKTLLYNHVYGPDSDTALWTNFDFSKSLKAGAEAAGQPFSGDYDFVDTHMYWPITHMVAPEDDALQCADCHQREGRLKDLQGFYLPGGGAKDWINTLGLTAILLTLLGVIAHLLIRLLAKRGRSDA